MNNEKYNGSGALDLTAFSAVNAADLEKSVAERPVVYICSPLSGNVEKNMTNARRYSRFAAMHGAVPFTPHILYTQYMDDDVEYERRLAMSMNKRMLGMCNELWVFGKRMSPGMKEEVSFARRNGIRIRYFTETCKEVRA